MSAMRLLRVFLGFCAVAWGVSFLGVVVPWPLAEGALQGWGAGPIPYDPMLDYWLRMASGAFALVGGLYLLLMLQPRKYWPMIPWFGLLTLVEGVILLAHGLRLGLPPLPFYADTSACFVGGAGVLVCWWKANRAPEGHSITVVAGDRTRPRCSPAA